MRLLLFVLVVLAPTLTLAQPKLVPVDQEIPLAEVLRLVDPAYPGLQAVTAATAAGDLAAAQQALLKHFASREKPVLPPATFPGVGEGNSMCVAGKASPEQAAVWLKHTFTLSNNDLGKQETYDLGPQIQWLKNPSEALSWVLYLNQLNHLASLSGLYRESKDEKLVTEIGTSVLTWSQQCPRWYGYTNKGEVIPSGMEVRNRLCNLIAAYEIVRKSPSLTPEMHLAFWKVFIASARELMTYSGVTYAGLVPLAVMFPEFTESRQWLQSGEENLRACLVDRTSPDGAWDTQSISYQTVPVPWAGRVLEFLQANPGSGDFAATAAMVKQQMGKLLGLMLQIAMPNGGLPNVGDTYGRSDWSSGVTGSVLTSYLHSQMTAEQQQRLGQIGDPYARLKATLAAAAGEAGAEPAATSMGFPESGYYVMRSGWQPAEARYAYLDLTPQGMGHAHNDAGHLEIYGYGKPLLADTGDYFLGWGYRAALHNTVEVDGQDQARGAQQAPMLPCEWLTTAGFDFAEVAHRAYGSLGVTHRRKLVYVKAVPGADSDYFLLCDLLEGEGSHTYEQFFHFAGKTQLTPATVRLDDKSLAAASVDEGVANLQVIPAHTAGLKLSLAEAQETKMLPEDKYERAAMLGWMVTGGTFQRVKAPVAVYRREGAGPQAFYDVLVPTPAGGEAEATVETLPVSAGGRPLPPATAAGLTLRCTVSRPRYAASEVTTDRGANLALGKPAAAEINQTSIPASSGLFTDGDRSPRAISGAVSSSPYTPGVLLKGRFSVDLQAETEVNCVVLAHGTFNGTTILYTPEKLSVQYWDGAGWQPVREARTSWSGDEVSETLFTPVRTTRLSVEVERAAGGRLALREFEAYRVPEAELQRAAARRAERVTQRFTDVILVSHAGPGLREYGPYRFDGELAILRLDEQGAVRWLRLKDATELAGPGGRLFASETVQDYYNSDPSPDATPERVAVPGPQRALQITGAQVQLQPAQQGFAAAQPSAVVTWQTDRPATSQVRFGEGARRDRRSTISRELTTRHRVHVPFLEADKTYGFSVVAVDGAGNRATAEVGANR